MKHPPDILMQKTPRGFLPYDIYSSMALGEMINGQVMTVKERKGRKLPPNARYWIGLQSAVDNCDAWPTREHVHQDLKALCGYLNYHMNPLTGEMETRIDSTAFDRMRETDFRRYWDVARRRFAEKMGYDPWSETS